MELEGHQGGPYHIDQGLQLYQKQTPTQVLSCEYCEIFKNTYFEEHLQTAASAKKLHMTLKLRKYTNVQ